MSYTARKNVPEPDLKSVEEKPGTKRKSTQIETGDSTFRPASVPLKKAKTTQEPTKSTSTRVAPRQNSASATPRQKPAAPSQKPVAATSHGSNRNSKKRTSLTDDAFPEDPKTPAPPLKKPRVNRDAHEGNSKKPQAQAAKPLRRSGNVSLDLKCLHVEEKLN
jgi:hypothetical protein